MPPTPASTRSSRSAWSCRGPSADVVAAVRIAAEEGVPGPAPRGRDQPLGADGRAGDRPRLLEVPEPDRRRRPRPDDGPGRAGRRARPAQCPPQAARADVRARRLDQRPRDDRRDDRQQLGRGPVAAVRQDGRPRPRRSTSSSPTAPRRRSARSPPTSSTPSAPGPTASAGSIASVRDDRRRSTARRSRRSSRRSSGGSAATTSTSSSRACRSGPSAGPTSPGSSTWPG